MTTDQSLSRYAEWFIPIKIDTSSDEWKKWRSKYKHDGPNAIPVLFVVRADGKQLYGGVGSLPGDKLHQMLSTTAGMAGKFLNAKQLTTVRKTVQTAEEAIESGNVKQALAQLSRLKRIGTLGGLGSYDQFSLKADQLVQQLVEQAMTDLEQALQQIQASEGRYAAARQALQLQATYRGFAPVQRQIAQGMRSLGADPTTKAVLRRTREVATALRQLDHPSRQLSAAERLLEISTEANDPQLTSWIHQALVDAPLHWRSRSGHSTKARLAQYESHPDKPTVTLTKADGGLVRIPVSKLAPDSARMAELLGQLSVHTPATAAAK